MMKITQLINIFYKYAQDTAGAGGGGQGTPIQSNPQPDEAIPEAGSELAKQIGQNIIEDRALEPIILKIIQNAQKGLRLANAAIQSIKTGTPIRTVFLTKFNTLGAQALLQRIIVYQIIAELVITTTINTMLKDIFDHVKVLQGILFKIASKNKDTSMRLVNLSKGLSNNTKTIMYRYNNIVNANEFDLYQIEYFKQDALNYLQFLKEFENELNNNFGMTNEAAKLFIGTASIKGIAENSIAMISRHISTLMEGMQKAYKEQKVLQEKETEGSNYEERFDAKRNEGAG